MVVEFRDGGEVCRESGKAVFGRFAVGFDGEFSVGRVVDDVLPCVAKVLMCIAMRRESAGCVGACCLGNVRRGGDLSATVDAA